MQYLPPQIDATNSRPGQAGRFDEGEEVPHIRGEFPLRIERI
ncbi:hypothetical protein MPLB_210025 [Mesorhizobium sp. ORS 3324]|nr:hypothetical protein MPLB_210025 [Mesorhizobium sp. ORS 3324]